MKLQSLQEIEALMDLSFQRKQQVFAKIVAQEGRLRQQIRRLDEQARDAEQNDAHEIRAIGAHTVWKVWVERTKTNLNIELAQVLAQKERLKETVRKEYGKVLASRALNADQRAREEKALGARRLQVAIQSHFFTNRRT